MSKKSWKQEYYAMPARKVEEFNALQHSLQKWIGLTQENLAKHGIKNPPIAVDSKTCALCHHYINIPDDCFECPLAQSRNGTPCDSATDDEDKSPYIAYKREGVPEEMIIALQKAIVYLENKKGGK
ncbi:hypothetical protein [Nitrospira sp. BLG_1]|uniref:hypothetical protein n=1 Tax=Nitrospira sp. BLG_1 TaxID=3395883 RepID=UPI0039BC84E8